MFFPDVLKRWRGSANDAATVVDGIVCACPPPPTSLLEELAVDSEDFAEIAAVLRVDLRAVIETLLLTRPQTANELVERLFAVRTAERGPLAAAAVSAAAVEGQPSCGGGRKRVVGGGGRACLGARASTAMRSGKSR